MSQKDRMLEGRICKRFIETYFHPAPDEYGGDFTYLHLPLLFVVMTAWLSLSSTKTTVNS